MTLEDYLTVAQIATIVLTIIATIGWVLYYKKNK